MFQPNNNSTFGLNTNNTTFGQPNQFGQQPTFGSAANTSFGATNTGSVFGQPIQNQQTNSVFGAPPTNNTSSLFPSTANTSFGSTANAFGQTTANTFGNQGTAGTSNAFGSTTFNNASAFGASPTTGNSVFGQNQSQTPSLFGSQATNTGLCGSSLFQTPTTSFGINPQTNNPGNTSFGAQASTPTAFGSNTGIFQNNKPAGALFGTSNTFGSSTFGTNNNTLGISTQQQTTGTTIRFNPPTGNDYIQKAGAQQNVPTRHQNITAMKEYESKSVDELRLEDYGANRKGSQNTTTNSLFGGQSSFGNITGTPFGQPQNNNTSVFGQTQQQTTQPTTNIFGSLNSTTNPLGNANTSLFSSNNAFGTLNSTNTSTANTFGQPNTFNQANAGTTNTFANTSFGSNLFGQSSTAGSGGSVFGQTQQPTTNTLATTGLFGAQQPSSTLGSSNLFQTTTTPFGITPPTSTSNTTFGVPTTTASTFGTSTGNMFQAKPNNLFSGNSTLGNTTFNSFSSNNNTIRFNQPQDQQKTGLGLSSSLGSTTQTFGGLAEVKPANDLKLFGATNSVGQTFDAFNSSNSLFGGGQQSNTSLFNFNPTNTTFGQTNSPLNGLQQQQQHQQQQQQQNQLNNQSRSPLSSDLLMNRLRTLPYGDSSITHDEMSPIKVTTEPKLFKMSSKSNSIVTKPPNTDRVRPNSVLFDGLEDPTDMKCALDVFVPKKNIKKLVLKSKPSSPETDVESPEESPSISALHKIVQNIDDSGNINDENIPKSAYQSSCAQESRITPRSNLSTPEPLSVSFSSPRSGVILNRPDYHTQPSLNELESLYKPDTDSCMVDKFLIENHYGSILFEEPMDIKGLNLDEIVHIRKKEVVVYPDDSVKPPIGQGLNRPAIITLYQVWPTDKKNHETIKDVNRLKLMQYSETIEKATLRKGARFIDYRPQTGAWVFAVEHFSKYTLTEDDESIQPQPPLPQLAQLAQIPPSLPPSTVDSIEKFEDLDAMRDSIFNDEDLCVISPQKYKKPLPSHSAKRVARDSPINIRSLQVKFETKVNYPKIRSMKLKPDLFAAENRLLKDISSIKIAGTPKVRFLNGSRNFCVISGQSIIVQQLNLLDGQLIPKLGQYFTNHSSVIDFQMNPTLAPYIETEDYIDIAETHDLLHALYGDLKTDKAYAKQNERLLRVINYLSARNAEISVPNNVYKKIIYHWACNRYDLASFVAIESNHPRLALLITAANIDRDLMIEQLHVWRMSCADQYIEKDLLKIYVLLAGLTEWKLSDNRTIDCLKGLHWTQQLNLLLLNIKSLSTEPDKYGFHLLPKFLDMLDTDTNDVDFHILSRKKPCHILSAAPKMNIIEEWFLLESLKSFHILCTETEWSDSDILHCNMVAQLGAVDIKWACFVALHIINNEIRNGILIKCLEQNIGQINQEVETWLLEKLKIPKEFIDNAKILSASANWFSPLTSMQQG